MNLRLAKNLPNGVEYTLGPSPSACILNLLRLVPSYRRWIGERLIGRVSDGGDGHVAVSIKGDDGILYFPQTLPVGELWITLPEQLYRWHWHQYQIPETRILPGDVVFDCGSAEGAFAFLNRKIKCDIHAFEPLPDFISALNRTFADTPNVHVVAAALGEKPASAFVGGSGVAARVTEEDTGIPVRIESIDSYCDAHGLRLSYLKADLEGYEMNTLRGAAETISACKPRIAITTYHLKDDPIDICNWLRKVNPKYRMLLKGLNKIHGNPVMLHAW